MYISPFLKYTNNLGFLRIQNLYFGLKNLADCGQLSFYQMDDEFRAQLTMFFLFYIE